MLATENTQHAPSTKTEYDYLCMVELKNGHKRKNLTQNGEPQRYSREGRRRSFHILVKLMLPVYGCRSLSWRPIWLATWAPPTACPSNRAVLALWWRPALPSALSPLLSRASPGTSARTFWGPGTLLGAASYPSTRLLSSKNVRAGGVRVPPVFLWFTWKVARHFKGSRPGPVCTTR